MFSSCLPKVSEQNNAHLPIFQTLLHPSFGVPSLSVEKSLLPSFWAGFLELLVDSSSISTMTHMA